MAAPATAVGLVLRAYPRPWRERYGAEMAALLAERQPGWWDLLDLARGGLDARLHRLVRPPAQLVAAMPRREVVMAVPSPRPYGVVEKQPIGEISRRRFLGRMLGVGAGILGLEFIGGSLAFLWPQIRSGLGAKFPVGTLQDIVAEQASFANGWPFAVAATRSFLINVPAARALALGQDASIPNPTADQLLALYRKCPHLGCQVPGLCDELKRFTCRCHGSTYNILGEKLKEGPAQRGMDRFAVEIGANGIVTIDTSQYTLGNLDRQDVKFLSFVDAAPYDRKCQ
ncbi:MAG TPA: Rieske (2Fe-2S) protein [Methylomirabilota bacterium]|jgi:cytochrome b6-f complex iron-sulfur subunit|nr:Rieske (2Fe-2S) protein [Methylomirabilota bacterium]